MHIGGSVRQRCLFRTQEQIRIEKHLHLQVLFSYPNVKDPIPPPIFFCSLLSQLKESVDIEVEPTAAGGL